LGLWKISIGGFFGVGGQISFGQDDGTGQGFATGRVGWGLGLVAKYDPLGKRPGSSMCADPNSTGITLNAFVDVLKLSAGPLDGRLLIGQVGYNLNAEMMAIRPERFNEWGGPKLQVQNQFNGPELKLGTLGLEVGLFTARR
jgi:hypothetical protein